MEGKGDEGVKGEEKRREESDEQELSGEKTERKRGKHRRLEALSCS